MPLPPKATLNRFGLLEQTLSQRSLVEEFESLIASPSTPTLLKAYFTLLSEKKKIEHDYFTTEKTPQLNEYENRLQDIKQKINALFEQYEKEAPELTTLCKAHLFIAAKTKRDGTWAIRSSDAVPEGRTRAIPLLEELKKMDFGIAYRLEAEIFIDENNRRHCYQQAAETGDLYAKALWGYDYLAYLIGESTNNKEFAYPGTNISPSPLTHFQEALKENGHEIIVKKLTFLVNLCRAINDLTPKDTPLDNQTLYDKKLITLLECAESISADSQLVSEYIQNIKKAINTKNYLEARAEKDKLYDYVYGIPNEERNQDEVISPYDKELRTVLKQAIQELANTLPQEDNDFRKNLNTLYNLYQEEITRMQEKSRLSVSETQYVKNLQAAKRQLVGIDNLTDQEKIKEQMSGHCKVTWEALQTVPHSSRFIRIVEYLYNTVLQALNLSPDYKLFEGEERKNTQTRFNEIKDQLQNPTEGDNEEPSKYNP